LPLFGNGGVIGHVRIDRQQPESPCRSGVDEIRFFRIDVHVDVRLFHGTEIRRRLAAPAQDPYEESSDTQTAHPQEKSPHVSLLFLICETDNSFSLHYSQIFFSGSKPV
jgi:hypothetical protein